MDNDSESDAEVRSECFESIMLRGFASQPSAGDHQIERSGGI